MTFKPAHKDSTAGQIRNDITLADYIKRKEPLNKLTFEEWLRQSSFIEPDAGTYSWLKDCWQAAQENK